MLTGPARSCKLYKEQGCSHVDGYLCDFPTCLMLKKYEQSSILTILEQKDVGAEYEQVLLKNLDDLYEE